MKRQRLRKLLLIASLLLFPITLYYFSPALIVSAGLDGIINGSFIVFVLMFALSIPFGRLFCAYACGRCNKICPMGIDVVNEMKNNAINNSECIQCCVCVDNCPKNLLSYGMIERKGNDNGK